MSDIRENNERNAHLQRRARLRKKRRRHKRILIALESVLILVLLVFITGFGYVNNLLGKTNYREIKVGSIGVNSGVAADEAKTDESQTENTGKTVKTRKSGKSGKTGKEFVALVGLDTRDSEDDAEDYSESMNSDTMIIACIDHDAKSIKLVSVYRDTYLNVFYNNGTGVAGYDDYYTKANNAYAQGGATQFLTMLNKNLDLNISEYVTVNFGVVAEVIDDLGGLDIAMTREEAIHMNNHNEETATSLGQTPEPVELPPQEEFDGAELHTFHLKGSQAVAYARIRQTEGNDMKRTQRQRDVLGLLMDKAKSAGIKAVLNIANTVLPEVETSLDSTQIVSMATTLLGYKIGETSGFPYPGLYTMGEEVRAVLPEGLDAILPVTLESNVKKLHEFFWPGESYTPSGELKSYSDAIANESGFVEGSLGGAVVDEGTPETSGQ